MKKKILFFILGGILTACAGIFSIPNIVQSAPQSQITVSAVVLEHITVIKEKSDTKIMTNLKTGYWDIKTKSRHLVVAQY